MSSSSSSSTMSGKIVIITGASFGMGKATALYLAQKGVQGLTLFARRSEPLQELAQEIANQYPSVKTLTVVGDVANAADNERAIRETVDAFGGLHGAFINAGVYKGGVAIPEISDADIDEIINVNIKGVIYGLRYAIPAIKKTIDENKGEQGSIVVNSSGMGEAVIGPKSIGASMYSASKAFVNNLVETAALENAPHIRINAVLPGVVQTSIMPVDDATYQAFANSVQPYWGRPGKPVEVASLVGYLLSDEASFVSGAKIKVDGLWTHCGVASG